MERVNKKLVLLLLLVIVVVALAPNVEGGRRLKSREEKDVDHPQSFLGGGGLGGIFPSPGFAGVVFGPSGFCTFPGGCTPPLPTTPRTGGTISPPAAP